MFSVGSFKVKSDKLYFLLDCICFLLLVQLSEAQTNIGDRVELDTIFLGTRVQDTICIGEKVLLSCDPAFPAKDVLSYEWRIAGKSEIISTQREFEVSPKTTTKYVLSFRYLSREGELVENGDFEQGNVGFTTQYSFAVTTHTNEGKELYPEGTYRVGKNPRTYHPDFLSISDHTGDGQMLIGNGDPHRNRIVWEQSIYVKKDEIYAFSTWVNWVNKNCSSASPLLYFRIGDEEVSCFGRKGYLSCIDEQGVWLRFYTTYKAPRTGNITISLRNKCIVEGGNDFAVDDISFTQVKVVQDTVVVKVSPQVAIQPLISPEFCEGATVNLNPSVYGSGTLTYAWSKQEEGEYRLKSALPVLSIPDVRLEDAGHYRYVVSGVCKPDTVEFDLAVREKLRLVGNRYDTIRVCVGERVVLSADRFNGYKPVYAWRNKYNGFQPVTADSMLYFKNSVALSDTGEYLCSVKDGAGCSEDEVKSILEVTDKPELQEVTASEQLVCKGSVVRLGASAVEANNWILWENLNTGEKMRKNSGESFLFTVNENTSFRVMAVNSCDTSAMRLLEVKIRPELKTLKVSDDQEECVGESILLNAEVNAEVAGYVTYRWTGPLSGNTAKLTIWRLTESTAGKYSVTAEDECGNSLQDSVELKVIHDLDGLVMSESREVCRGEEVSFTVSGGSYGMDYRWTTPAGAQVSGNVLSVRDVQPRDTGTYECLVKGRCGHTMVMPVHLSLRPEPQIEAVVNDVTVCPGETVTFEVNKKEEGVRYEWFREGTSLGIVDQDLVINEVTAAEAGKYECVVANGCDGYDNTLACFLQVREATRIVSYTPSQYVQPHSQLSMYVNAVGEENVFVWTLGNKEVGRGPVLHIEDIGAAGGYLYRCTVTGKCGTAWIAIAVNVDDYIYLDGDAAVDLCEGSEYAYSAGLLPAGCVSEENLTYSWTFGGRKVCDKKAIKFSDFSEADAGEYICDIVGSCGNARLKLNVNVLQKPLLTDLRVGKEFYCQGEDLQFRALSNTTKGVTFSWLQGEKPVNGSGLTLEVEKALPSAGGIYTCRAVNACGSDQKTVTVLVKPVLQVSPEDTVLQLCIGDPVTLEVRAEGENLEYAWIGPSVKNWTGADRREYTNAGVGLTEAGRYRCDVTSVCGTAVVYRTLEIEDELAVNVTPDREVCSHTDQVLEVRTNLGENVGCTWFLPDGSVSRERILYVNDIGRSGVYRYAVKSRCVEKEGEIRLEVYPDMGPLKTSPDTMVCKGGTVRLNAFAEGRDVSYCWMGPRAFTENTAFAEISDMTAERAGTYELSVTDICKRTQTGKIKVGIWEEFEHAEISRDTVVCPGEDVSLEVKGGSVTLQYEWRLEGNVKGHAAVLPLTALRAEDAGAYICRMTGICGIAEDTVNVGVYKPLTAMKGEDPAPVCPGEDVLLTVEAEGEAVRYVWRKEGKGYVGTTDSQLRLQNVQLQDSGMYICDITSLCGEARFEFHLEVLQPTVVLGAPSYKHATKDDPEDIAVRAEGDRLIYEWFREGIKQDCKASVFVQEPWNKVDTLHFMCVVSGTCGIDTVYTLLDVGNYRRATSSPDTMCAGSSYSYLVEVVPENSPCWGDEPTVYTWYRDNTGRNDTIREAGQILHFQNVRPEDSGIYHCHVYRECGDTLFDLELTVLDVPEIRSINPTDSIVIEGNDYGIEVDASGSALNYSWMKDGAVFLPFIEGPRLEFNPVKVENSGKYTVTISNKCGSFSRNSLLKVYEKTLVVSPKRQRIEVCYGQGTVLRVEAVGGEDLVYRWFEGERLLAASYDNFYELKEVQESKEYRCEVVGRADADTAYLSLIVNPLPEISFTGNLKICRDEDSYLQTYESGVDQGVAYSWTLLGAAALENGQEQKVRVKWSGEGKGGIIKLVHTDLLTRCQSFLEKQVVYQELPEVNLILPEVVGFCVDSLPLHQAWPSGGEYRVNGIPATVLEFSDKSSEYKVKYRYTEELTGCSAMAEANVTIAREPVIRMEKHTDITGGCRPLALNIVQVTPGAISWEGEAELDVTDSLHALYIPTREDAGVLYFRVSVEDVYGCRDEDYEYVTSVPLPQLKLPADTVIGRCDKEEKMLEVTVDCRTDRLDRLIWSPDTNVRVLDYSSAVLHFAKAGDFLFEVAVEDIFGCEDKDSLAVKVIDGPVLENREVCYGEKIDVDCGEYRFVWSDGFTQAHREVRDTGSVFLQLNDRLGCSAEATFTVHPLPVLNLPDSLLLLKGETLILQPSLDGKYAPYQVSWQDGSTGPEYEVGQVGKYEVVVTDNLGCVSTALVVVEDKTIIVSPHELESVVCFGTDVRFEVETKGNVEEYRWYRNGIRFENPQGHVLELKKTTESADYRCEVIGTANSDTCRIRLVVKELPQVYLPQDTVFGICRKDLTFVIEGQYVTEALDTLIWYPENSITEQGNGKGEIVFDEPGNYFCKLTVRNRWGCEGADSMNITVEGPLEIEGKEVCEGGGISVSTEGYLFKWSDGYEQPERIISEVGLYVLEGTDRFGCVTEAVYAVHPMPVFDLPDTLYLYAGQHHLFEVNPDESFGPYTIRWSEGSRGPVCDVSEEGSYSVEVTDRIGCTMQKTVAVIRPEHYYAPNAFLPKSSGENSRFYLKDVNFSEPFEMYIYNRWGELVYKTRVIGFEGGWDGTFKGEDCLPGAYLWVAFSGGRNLGKGTLVLVR